MKRDGFFEAVYDIVARIPRGRVTTYGQIAIMAGNPFAARAVGYAMHAAPAARALPCHRVVNKEGAMPPGAIFGGAGRQQALLEAEGVTFLPDGRIDMTRHLWDGSNV